MYQKAKLCTVSCSLFLVRRGTLRLFYRVYAALTTQIFGSPSCGVLPRNGNFASPRPTEDCSANYLFGRRLYGLLEVGFLGLVKSIELLNGGRKKSCYALMQRAYSLLCGAKTLKGSVCRFFSVLLSCVVGHLTNLRVHYLNCLLSSVRQCYLWASKVRSFSSPLSGSYNGTTKKSTVSCRLGAPEMAY